LDVVAMLRVDATNAALEDVGSDVAVSNAPALPGRESFDPEVPCFFFGERRSLLISDMLGAFGRRRRRRWLPNLGGLASLALDVVAVLRVDATKSTLASAIAGVAVAVAAASASGSVAPDQAGVSFAAAEGCSCSGAAAAVAILFWEAVSWQDSGRFASRDRHFQSNAHEGVCRCGEPSGFGCVLFAGWPQASICVFYDESWLEMTDILLEGSTDARTLIFGVSLVTQFQPSSLLDRCRGVNLVRLPALCKATSAAAQGEPTSHADKTKSCGHRRRSAVGTRVFLFVLCVKL
jgi:hypothetical protein